MRTAIFAWALAFLRSWQRLQVSYYGGKYSVQRVLALEAYTKSSSVPRVIFVCIGTLLPMLAFVFAQELVPLQDPKDGWRANYGFWIRATVMVYVGAHALTVQATYLIDGISISVWRQILLSICASIGAAACSVVVASKLIFPIPFYVLTMTPVFCLTHLISFRAVVGAHVFQQILAHRDQLIDYMNFVSPQFMVAFVYPAYEALFRFAEGSQHQLLVILLLPVLKIIVKHIMLRCSKHMEDMTPEAVIFTVDFFNALYIATCMQSATSFLTVSFMTVTDLLQTIFMLYGLHRRTAKSQAKLRPIVSTVSDDYNLLETLALLYRNPDKFKLLPRTGVRVRSCLPHSLSASDKDFLDSLVQHEASFQILRPINISRDPLFRTATNALPVENVSRLRWIISLSCRSRTSTIYPFVPNSTKTTTESSREESRPIEYPNVVRVSRATVLREALETLFTTECLVLTAYLEAVIPLFYTFYVLVMVHLPSANYHTELAGITPANVGNTVLPVFVFGLLQVASFLLLGRMIKRNCGMSALNQLAFVLETQMPLVQGKLMFWAGLTLCFRVVHFGVDFTFKR